MYAVKFIRKDGQSDEVYYYHWKEDAEYHLHLFDNDDSGLYVYVNLYGNVTANNWSERFSLSYH